MLKNHPLTLEKSPFSISDSFISRCLNLGRSSRCADCKLAANAVKGTKKQVLAIMIWKMCDAGCIGGVAANGTLLTETLFILTIFAHLFASRWHNIQTVGL